jgi:hypothetical protein
VIAGVGTNRYAYAQNDPVNGSDASGHLLEGQDDPNSPDYYEQQRQEAVQSLQREEISSEEYAAARKSIGYDEAAMHAEQAAQDANMLQSGEFTLDADWAADVAAASFVDALGKHPALGGILGSLPGKIPGKNSSVENGVPAVSTKSGYSVTKHSMNQKINRSVRTADELDALKNPLQVTALKLDTLGRTSQKYIGTKATVTINPDTKSIITVYPTSSKFADRLISKMADGN